MKIKQFLRRVLTWPLGRKLFASLMPLAPGEPVFFKDDYRAFSTEGYGKNVYVNKSINEIATTVAGIPWILTDLEGKEILRHPLLDLLNRPNPAMSRSAFFIWLMSYFFIDGNGYVVSVSPDPQGRQEPRELWPVQPNWIEPVKGDDRRKPTLAFNFVKADGSRVPIPEGTVMHIKTFNPLNPLLGLSPIKAARFSITQGNESKRWNVALLQNHARPAGAFVTEGAVQPAQATRIKEEIMEKWSGSDNAGKPLFLQGGMKWTQFGLNASDMDWLEGQKISSREIALMYGVPPELIGDTSNKTYSNYKEARRAFYQETVLPLMMFLKDELNTWLVPKFGDNLVLDFDTDQVVALQEDRDLLFQRLNTATFLSTNEKRDVAGFETVAGGDAILVPLNLVPLGFAGTEEDSIDLPESKQAREVQSLVLTKEKFPTLAEAKEWVLEHDFKAPKVDEKPDTWRFRQFPPGRCSADTIRTITITSGVKAVVCKPKEGRSGCHLNGHEKAFNLKTQNQKRQFWKQFDRRRLGFFGRVEALVANQLRADFRAAEKAVRDSGTIAVINEAVGTAVSANTDSWKLLFRRIYNFVGDDFASEVFNQVKGADDAPEKKQDEPFRDIWLEAIEAWLAANSTIRTLGIINTTTKGIRKIISDAIGEGLSIPKISKRIAEFRGVAVSARSRLIARTEVISASNLGSLAGAQATGIPIKKEWIATADERVRDAHADADGQIVEGADGAFIVDGEELLFPGDTSLGATGPNIFNCRCATGYIPIESEDNVPVAAV